MSRSRAWCSRAASPVLLLAGLLLACDPGADRLTESGTETPPPPAELSGVVFEGYVDDVRDLVVAASSARIDTGTGKALLDNVRISFAGEVRGPARITAPSAEFALDRDDFVLTGGVRGTTQDGERFSTSEVRYDNATRTLRARTPVRVERSNLTLQADGMELDVATRTLKLTGRVNARFDAGPAG